MRVVLDTNVIIAAFATRGLCSDLFELCLAEHHIILSKYILDEVHPSLTRKLRVPPSVASSIVQYLRKEAEIVVPSNVLQAACRDKTDLKILGTAVAGMADVIVTGDNDLLILNEFKTIPILDPRAFWDLAQKKSV